MKKYLYVWVEVGEANPETITLINDIIEKQHGIILPDVIPCTSPDRITFKHVFIEAENDDKAYLYGGRFVKRTVNTAFNDYVIPLE